MRNSNDSISVRKALFSATFLMLVTVSSGVNAQSFNPKSWIQENGPEGWAKCSATRINVYADMLASNSLDASVKETIEAWRVAMDRVRSDLTKTISNNGLEALQKAEFTKQKYDSERTGNFLMPCIDSIKKHS